ncbi:hypothetical protein ACROYT_G028647 [Oculina patagonica]
MRMNHQSTLKVYLVTRPIQRRHKKKNDNFEKRHWTPPLQGLQEVNENSWIQGLHTHLSLLLRCISYYVILCDDALLTLIIYFYMHLGDTYWHRRGKHTHLLCDDALLTLIIYFYMHLADIYIASKGYKHLL